MRLLFVVAAVGICLAVPRAARATLGGDRASIAVNARRLGASRVVRALAWGERHELTLPSGIRVHQFVSPAGVVYAVAWSGPRIPDLRELLGPHFEALSRRVRHGHHSLTVKTPELDVRAQGHRGFSTGRAFVPSLIPPGFDPERAVAP